MGERRIQKFFVLLLISLLCQEVRARRIYHVEENELDLYGTTRIEDYGKKSRDEEWMERRSVSKRALGPTGARVLKAALITAGIIHGASLAISTAKLGFDIWFEQHKCCGIHKSICSDYDEYKGIKDRVLAKSEEIDNHWLTVQNTETYLFKLSRLNTYMYEEMKKIDDSMGKLVKTLDSDLEVKIRNARFDLQKKLEAHNASLSNLTLVTITMNSIFSDVFNNVLRASSFVSDLFMLRWVSQKWKKMNVPVVRARSNAVSSNAGVVLNPSYMQRAGWFIKGNYKIAAKALTFGATTIFTVYASVQDILYVIKTIDTCTDIRDGMRNALNTWKPKENHTNYLFKEVVDLKNNVTAEYDLLKSSLYSTNFTSFTREVIKLMENASDASTMKQVGLDLTDFNTRITTANFSYTEYLVQKATLAFSKVKYKLTCLTKKFNTLNYAVSECKKGTDTLHNLFLNAQKQEIKDAKDCVDNGYMTEEQVTSWVTSKMNETGYQTDCILNDQDKKKLVCQNWVDNLSDQANAAKEKINVTQVKWFIYTSKCPPADLINDTRTSICTAKDSDKTLSQVLTSFFKYNITQVETSYNSCALSTSRAELVCRDKNDGYFFDEVVAKNKLYSEAAIKAVYDNCPRPQITPSVEKSICRNKARGRDLTNPAYEYFIEEYGMEQVQAAYNKCAKKDSLEVEDYHPRFRSHRKKIAIEDGRTDDDRFDDLDDTDKFDDNDDEEANVVSDDNDDMYDDDDDNNDDDDDADDDDDDKKKKK